jgi:hypothetical protein
MTPATALLIALPASGFPAPAAEPSPATQNDLVTLADGRTFSGRITAADAGSLQIQVRPDPDQPPASLRLPLALVVHAQFNSVPAQGPFPGENNASLGILWNRNSQFVHVPGSPAPTLGLRYADALLDSLSAGAAQAALELLVRLEKSAPAPADRISARQKRLRAMVAVHRLEAAAREARQILGAAAPPSLAAEALIVMGLEAQTALAALEQEHPRWAVDDRIRPQRQSLFFAALDAFLDAALQPEPDPLIASRALWNAARLYQQSGDSAAASACLRDILWLHKDTPTADRARPILASAEQSRELPVLPHISIPNAP